MWFRLSIDKQQVFFQQAAFLANQWIAFAGSETKTHSLSDADRFHLLPFN